MATLSRDTSPEAEELLLSMMRQTPPWRKMELLDGLNAMARDFAMAGLRHRCPTATEEELRRRLADLLLGPELALKVYGPLLTESATRPSAAESAARPSAAESAARPSAAEDDTDG